MSTIELKEIDTTIAYEGYLWMSNADRAVAVSYTHLTLPTKA